MPLRRYVPSTTSSPTADEGVEIDVWPSNSGPIVTHGYTLSASVPFADVCRAIGSFIDDTYGPYDPTAPSRLDFPVLVSLECHVPYHQQSELAQIMIEIWGDRVVQGPIEGIDDDWVTPRDLAGRIVVMVEYYPPAILNRPAPEEDASNPSKPSRKWSLFARDSSSSSSSSSDSEETESEGDDFGDDGEAKSFWWPFGRKKSKPEGEEGQLPEEKPKISDELASLGYYARSVKPAKGWLSRSRSPTFMTNISKLTAYRRIPGSTPCAHQHLRVRLRQASLFVGRTSQVAQTCTGTFPQTPPQPPFPPRISHTPLVPPHASYLPARDQDKVV